MDYPVSQESWKTPDLYDGQPGQNAIAFWGVAELRERTLFFADRFTVMRMMRLDRRSLPEAMRSLHRQALYARLKSFLAFKTVSCRLPPSIDYRSLLSQLLARTYRSIVIDINFVNATLSASQWEELGETSAFYKGSGSHHRQFNWLLTYRPKAFDILIPPLARTLPNLRRVRFQHGNRSHYPTFWIVHLPAEGEAVSSTDQGTSRGHIEYVDFGQYPSDFPPPVTMHKPECP